MIALGEGYQKIGVGIVHVCNIWDNHKTCCTIQRVQKDSQRLMTWGMKRNRRILFFWWDGFENSVGLHRNTPHADWVWSNLRVHFLKECLVVITRSQMRSNPVWSQTKGRHGNYHLADQPEKLAVGRCSAFSRLALTKLIHLSVLVDKAHRNLRAWGWIWIIHCSWWWVPYTSFIAASWTRLALCSQLSQPHRLIKYRKPHTH